MRSSVVCLIAAVAAASLFAATPQTPRAGETIDVSIVNVDVVVTDRSGHRVHGLTRDDFELIEDGKPRAISNFAEYRPRLGGARGDVAVDAFGAPLVEGTPPPPRSVVLFVDAFALPRHDADPMFAALQKTLRDSVRPGDIATIVRWNPLRYRAETVVPWTSDNRLLTRAIDDLREDSTLGGRRRSSMNVRGTGTIAPDVANLTAGPRNSDARAAAMREEGLKPTQNALANRISGARYVGQPSDGALWDARSEAMRASFEQRRKVSIIKALMSSMASIEGRKALILATHRLGYYAGAEYFYAFGYNDLPYHDRGSFDMRAVMGSMIDAANAAGVTIYPIYPEGLGTDGALPNAAASYASLNTAYDYQVLTNETSALANVAVRTGGMMAWGAKDIVTLMPRINEDLDSYYSLAYRSTGTSNDERRPIEVKAKSGDYIVRARHEYTATSDETKIRQRVTAALFRDPDGASRLDVRATFGTPTKEGKKERDKVWRVPLTLHIPMSQLVALEGDGGVKSGSMSIYVATAAALGTNAEVTRETVPFTMKGDVSSQYATYNADVLFDDATQYIGIAVVDDTSRDATVLRLKLPRSSR
jgi:VWFA-related protein